tara:strand:- start:212 stop:502 length:291 start_codon:yes stop_codon:yes gene_type:complete
MGSRKNGRLKHKNHAQDCGTLTARECGVSVRRSCHGLQVWNGVHPFDGTGMLPVIAQPPDCCWTRRVDISEDHALEMHDVFTRHAKTRANLRACIS